MAHPDKTPELLRTPEVTSDAAPTLGTPWQNSRLDTTLASWSGEKPSDVAIRADAAARLDGVPLMSSAESEALRRVEYLNIPEERVQAVWLMQEIDRLNAVIKTKGDILKINPTDAKEIEILSYLQDLLRQRHRLVALELARNTPGANLQSRRRFSDITPRDIHTLRQSGGDVMHLLLVDAEDAGNPIMESHLEDMIETTLVVDFWWDALKRTITNPSLQANIGADDILPAQVFRARIDGTECVRKSGGYYSVETGKYVPIAHGTEIEVLEIKEVVQESVARRKRPEAAQARGKVPDENATPQERDKYALASMRDRVRKSPRGVTMCSQSAQESAERLGFQIPTWNARAAFNGYSEAPYSSASAVSNPQACDTSCGSDTVFWDLCVFSNTKNGKKYGHRACACRLSTGEVYVSDPYMPGGNRDGIHTFDAYTWSRRILKAYGYKVSNGNSTSARIFAPQEEQTAGSTVPDKVS